MRGATSVWGHHSVGPPHSWASVTWGHLGVGFNLCVGSTCIWGHLEVGPTLPWVPPHSKAPPHPPGDVPRGGGGGRGPGAEGVWPPGPGGELRRRGRRLQDLQQQQGQSPRAGGLPAGRQRERGAGVAVGLVMVSGGVWGWPWSTRWWWVGRGQRGGGWWPWGWPWSMGWWGIWAINAQPGDLGLGVGCSRPWWPWRCCPRTGRAAGGH